MFLKKKELDYISVIKYLALLLSYLVFTNLQKESNIFSISVFVSSIFSGANFFVSIIEQFFAILIFNQTGLLLSLGSADLIILGAYLIYRKYQIKMSMEIIAFTLLSLIPYIFLGDTTTFIPFESRIYYCLATAILSFILLKTIKLVNDKGLKYKLNYEELITLSVSVILFGLGVSNFISPLVWKSVLVLAILTCSFIYKVALTTLISSLLGLSLSIYYSDLTYIAIFLMLALAIECSMPLTRYLSCTAVILCDFVAYYFFKAYSSYSLLDFFSVLIPSLIFALIPTSLLTKLKDRLYLFREKQLTRQAINRNRTMLSNKLYDLSGVFTEIACAFSEFNKKSIDEQKAKDIIKKEVKHTICGNCQNEEKCKKEHKQNDSCISKIIDIGIAKGKLTLIDFPKEICESCSHSNEMLYCINKQLGDYRRYLLEQMNVNCSRNLIKEETLGIAEILKGLAIDSGTTLKYQSKLERTISKKLFERGIIVNELLIYGEGKKTSVSIVVSMKEFSLSVIEDVLSNAIGYFMEVTEKANIDDEKCYMCFKISATYDAVFGVSCAKKENSFKSGDTYTVTRIKEDKILIALSDGMGSGEMAERVSSSSLSLIETFYKAGLKDELILNTINKLLNINCEDIFTALDVAVIDLKECSSDFIKYGSPYGFIINKEGIKIVEGNTLPLGILEDLKPSCAHTNICDGDIILLVTDGISDAFGSSGDIIDYLRALPSLNPQTLTDKLLAKAKELNGGKSKDDMTCLALRIFKKNLLENVG